MQYESFTRLVRTLTEHGVRFVMIGVGAANLYARTGAEVFSTKDRDLFLPLDARNLLQAWQLSVEAGCDLWTDDEPLGKPLDLQLAEAVVSRRALTTATHPDGLTVDLTLTMAGFDFETIWKEHGRFNVGNVEILLRGSLTSSNRKPGRTARRTGFSSRYTENGCAIFSTRKSDRKAERRRGKRGSDRVRRDGDHREASTTPVRRDIARRTARVFYPLISSPACHAGGRPHPPLRSSEYLEKELTDWSRQFWPHVWDK